MDASNLPAAGDRPVVLIADPRHSSTALVEMKFKSAGFSVRIARDSQAALEILHTQPVAAALIDVELEPQSGFFMVEQIRALGYRIAIFMTEADPDQDTVNHAFDLGVEDFITKPFFPEVVIEKLKRLLGPDPTGATEDVLELVEVVELPDDAIQPLSDSMAGVVATEAGVVGGSLEGRRALDLFRAVVSKRRTGLLSLRRGDTKGMIYFEDGQIFQAILGSLAAEESFLELATWTDCVFKFEPGVTISRRVIKAPTAMLFEAAGRVS